MLHDRELAREFLAPLQAAHLETAQITVASPEGQGWRSKLAEKKRVKAAAASHHEPEVGEASFESDSHGKFDIEAEVKARMKALESTTRAQVHAQVLRDEIHHNDKGKMDDKIVMSDKASMHDKEDNEDRGNMDDTSCVDALLSLGANKALTNRDGLTALGLYRSKCRSSDDFRSALTSEARRGANPTIEASLLPPNGPTLADEEVK